MFDKAIFKRNLLNVKALCDYHFPTVVEKAGHLVRMSFKRTLHIEHKSVMPISIRITNGPGFQDLLAHGPMLGQSPLLYFEAENDSGEKAHIWFDKPLDNKEDRIVGEVVVIAAPKEIRENNKDERTLVIFALNSDGHGYFVVCRYNMRTQRSEEAMLLTQSEFTQNNPIGLWLVSTDRFYQYPKGDTRPIFYRPKN